MYKNILIILIIFFSSLVNISFSANEIKLLQGDEFNKVLKNTIENKSKLFLIFFGNNCQYCIYSIKLLKEKILSYFEEDENISFGVVNLDRKVNMWIAYRFNVTEIPYIILIENKKMYRFHDTFDEFKVVEFINEEKNVEDALEIPEDAGFFSQMNYYIANIIYKLSHFLQQFGINNDTSNILACVILGIIFLNIVYFEHKLICWVRNIMANFRKKNKNMDDNQENKDNKNNENEKSKYKNDKDNQKNKHKNE